MSVVTLTATATATAENGVDLWVAEGKSRYPLFMAAFCGRADAVSFLLQMGAESGGRGPANKLDCICAQDVNGDTALHAAALNGNLQRLLLLYHVRSVRNKQGLVPASLCASTGAASFPVLPTTIGNTAYAADGYIRTLPQGSTRASTLILWVESRFQAGETAAGIFGCDFDHLAVVIRFHGSRWTKCCDAGANCVYFYDRCAVTAEASSQWEVSSSYDESARPPSSRASTKRGPPPRCGTWTPFCCSTGAGTRSCFWSWPIGTP